MYADDEGRMCLGNPTPRLCLHLAADTVQSSFARKAQNINLEPGDCLCKSLSLEQSWRQKLITYCICCHRAGGETKRECGPWKILI